MRKLLNKVLTWLAPVPDRYILGGITVAIVAGLLGFTLVLFPAAVVAGAATFRKFEEKED